MFDTSSDIHKMYMYVLVYSLRPVGCMCWTVHN